MPPDRIPHVKRVVAKSGKVYRFFNTGKKDPRGNVIYAPLPDIADDGFWPRYTALKGGRTKRANAEAVITVPRLIDLYRKAPKYRSLEPNSKRLYDSGLNYAAKVFSIMPADMIEATDVEEYRDAIADTPSMANAFVRTVGALYAWATPKYAKVNPASGIDELPTGEHEPWPVDLLQRALVCEDDTVRLDYAGDFNCERSYAISLESSGAVQCL